MTEAYKINISLKDVFEKVAYYTFYTHGYTHAKWLTLYFLFIIRFARNFPEMEKAPKNGAPKWPTCYSPVRSLLTKCG